VEIVVEDNLGVHRGVNPRDHGIGHS